ncbi:hypothetical protein MCEMSEM23_00836 [Rhabdaerophilaceae bacterium]
MTNHTDHHVATGPATVDYNLGMACIGYGSLRMLRVRDFSLGSAPTPAKLILAESDPVGFCVEALSVSNPGWNARVNAATRSFIRQRLLQEAKGVTPSLSA